MFLKSIVLQNFRSYKKSSFDFSQKTTVIIGPNTSGKTNLLEGIYLLATGKSFKTEKDTDLIRFGATLSRVQGEIEDTSLEVLVQSPLEGERMIAKKFLVNGVSKRRVDFAGNLVVVLFSPLDLDLVSGSPSIRRNFLDSVLEQVDSSYRLALSVYQKAIRQRNALLERVQETGIRNEKQFSYWDEIVIANGSVITAKRGAFIEFLNSEKKDICDFVAFYDKSVISGDRLLQYKKAEEASGVTLVGPHRDDFSLSFGKNSEHLRHDVKAFGSRGQQRLVVLQLKLLQLHFIEKAKGERPVLLLDDIFSELDEGHIKHVLSLIDQQQTILTTTHEEFLLDTQKHLDMKGMIKLSL